MRVQEAAGGEGMVVLFGLRPKSPAMPSTSRRDLLFDGPPDERPDRRPLLIGGALTSAALSLAGAAFVVRATDRTRRWRVPVWPSGGAGLPDAAHQVPVLPAEAERSPAGSLDEVSVLRGDALQQAARQTDARLPGLRPPLPAPGVDPDRAAGRPRHGTSATPACSPSTRWGFVDQKAYLDRPTAAQDWATGVRDAAIWGTADIGRTEVSLCVADFGFMGGSMGPWSGKGDARRRARPRGPDPARGRVVVRRRPDGGGHVRPHAASRRPWLRSNGCAPRGVPFISVLTDPTTGGVFASYAAWAT